MYITHDKPLATIDYQEFDGKRAKKRYHDYMMSNAVMGFDIETTSFYYDGHGKMIPYNYENPDICKQMQRGGVMYHWQFIVEGNKFTGRTWGDLRVFLCDLNSYCPFYKICYVHNLAFEFMWLLNIMKFDGIDDTVFAREPRNTMYAYSEEYGLEFRCSYHLTQKTLAKWGKTLGLDKSKDLDYNVLRSPLTPLKPEELGYCFRDVEIIDKGIREYRSKYKYVCNIPLTLTGEVRVELYKVFEGYKKGKKKNKTNSFYSLCKKLIPEDYHAYKFILDAFIGGLVRRNPTYSGQVMSCRMLFRDISSSYPWAMISERYPLQPFSETTDLSYMNNSDYTYIVKFKARNVETKIPYLFLSSSKVTEGVDVRTMNGAIATATEFTTILTKPDFEIFKQCYDADIEILSLKRSKLGYLPDDFRRFLISKYKAKTELKGVDKVEYQLSKVVVNSCFGIMVQKIICDSVIFDIYHEDDKGNPIEWYKSLLTEDNFEERRAEALDNNSRTLTAPQIGTFITAYARQNLMKAVLFDPDNVIYTDTDSVKMVWTAEAEQMFEEYNKEVFAKHIEIANQLGIDPADLNPIGNDEDNPGQKKNYPIGVMSDDHTDSTAKFVTIGAKKYCVEHTDGSLEITVAGVPKEGGSACLSSIEDFHDGFLFSAKLMNEKGFSTKNIPYYINDQKPITMPDGYVVQDQYAICLEPTDYMLSDGVDMIDEAEDFFCKIWNAARNPSIFNSYA